MNTKQTMTQSTLTSKRHLTCSVPHRELLHKLRSVGILGSLWKWFKNCLTSRLRCVAVNGSVSELLPVLSSVPQGSNSIRSISPSTTHKDLGILFTNSLNWEDHYNLIISGAYRQLSLLRRTFTYVCQKESLSCIGQVTVDLLFSSTETQFNQICMLSYWQEYNVEQPNLSRLTTSLTTSPV